MSYADIGLDTRSHRSSRAVADASGTNKYGYTLGDDSYEEIESKMERAPLIQVTANKVDHHGESKTFKIGRFTISLKDIKIFVLFFVLVVGVVAFATQQEPDVDNTFALDKDYPLLVPLRADWPTAFVAVSLVIPKAHSYFPQDVVYPFDIFLQVTLEHSAQNNTWLPVANQTKSIITEQASNVTVASDGAAEAHGGQADDVSLKILFVGPINPGNTLFRLNFTTNAVDPVALNIEIIQHGSIYRYKELFAALVLLGMYTLIITEIIDRTVSAIVGSFLVLAVLAILGERPALDVVVSWIEYNTLALLFGMMIIVGVFSTTGFFEWIALKAYETSRGRVWTLVLILSVFTAVASGVLDNVTTMLLLTPIIVRLCKVGNMDPIPVLLTTVLISNVGGCSTAVGDPPMTIIVNNETVQREGIGFAEVFFYMAPGTAIVCAVSLLFLKWWFRKEFSQTPQLSSPAELHLRREIEIWKNTAKGLNVANSDERQVIDMLDTFIAKLSADLEGRADENALALSSSMSGSSRTFKNEDRGGPLPGLEALRAECVIHDKRLFVMCAAVLTVVVGLFFLENFISDWVHLPLPWISIVGAIILMILADIKDIESLLHKVEWGTLLFFGALFVLMEGVQRLGLVDWIGRHIGAFIASVGPDHRLIVAILVLVWVSAIVSAIIDSIPYTTAMIPIVVSLSQDPQLGLALRPLVFSLAFGSGLGGNGSLIGATANLVMAGLAEQNGYPIGFMRFAKVGTPMMLVSVSVATAYLLVIHCVFGFGVHS